MPKKNPVTVSSPVVSSIVTEWLTVPQVAKFLSCSQSYVRYLIRDKQLPAVNIGMKGRGTRVSKTQLDKFIKSRAYC